MFNFQRTSTQNLATNHVKDILRGNGRTCLMLLCFTRNDSKNDRGNRKGGQQEEVMIVSLFRHQVTSKSGKHWTSVIINNNHSQLGQVEKTSSRFFVVVQTFTLGSSRPRWYWLDDDDVHGAIPLTDWLPIIVLLDVPMIMSRWWQMSIAQWRNGIICIN